MWFEPATHSKLHGAEQEFPSTVTSAASGTTKYGYDALYRLTSWTAPSGQVTQYTYDPVGNRASMVSSAGTTAYSYDAADRMLTAGTTSYTDDNNGNQITKTTGATTVTYGYDPLNRMIAASGGGINSQYKYDGDGNRVVQIVPAGTYQYLNDTGAGLPVVLNENGPDGNIDYLYGLSVISETSSAIQYFYQTDGLGSAASLTDATGVLKASYAYDPWGKLTTPIDPLGTKNKYKFTRQALDPATGFYYLRARYDDPTLGRFTTRDPSRGLAVTPKSLNKYGYALSNPTTFSDPTGLFAIDAEASGNAQSTVQFGSKTGTCGANCLSSFVENTGNVLSLAGPLSSVARTVGSFYPIYEVPFQLESQFANGASRTTALLNVGADQSVNTGISLLATWAFGIFGGEFAAVALYGFNYGLPTAQ